MKDRLSELMKAYRERPDADRDRSLWEFVRERDPYVFSHHPAGACFREHVWEIGVFYVCKGCVMTFAGALAGAIFAAATGWLSAFTDIEVGLIFVLLLLPTVVSHLLNLSRWCRHVSRFLLGGLMISAVWMLFVTDSWLVRGVIVACYFGGKIPLERKRNRENQEIMRGNGTKRARAGIAPGRGER